MKILFSSATKIVLLMVVLNLNIISAFAAFIGIYRGTLDPKDVITLFGSVVTGVIFFYYGSKMQDNKPIPPTYTVSSTNG